MMARFRFTGALLLALTTVCAAATAAAAAQLTLTTAKGPTVFDVETANTPREQATGLMFRKDLAPNGGMIFVYQPPQPVVMWMKNTLIPLDMVFVGADHRVARIAAKTVPLSETHIPSGGDVQYVIELAGGTTARIGLKPGDAVSGQALDLPR